MKTYHYILIAVALIAGWYYYNKYKKGNYELTGWPIPKFNKTEPEFVDPEKEKQIKSVTEEAKEEYKKVLKDYDGNPITSFKQLLEFADGDDGIFWDLIWDYNFKNEARITFAQAMDKFKKSVHCEILRDSENMEGWQSAINDKNFPTMCSARFWYSNPGNETDESWYADCDEHYYIDTVTFNALEKLGAFADYN